MNPYNAFSCIVTHFAVRKQSLSFNRDSEALCSVEYDNMQGVANA